MQIQVKLGEPLWRAVGSRRLTLDWPAAGCVRVEEVLARLAADYPGFAEAYAGKALRRAYPYQLFVDASRIRLPGSEPGVGQAGDEAGPDMADGQTLFILLPAIGGRGTPAV